MDNLHRVQLKENDSCQGYPLVPIDTSVKLHGYVEMLETHKNRG